MKSMKQCCTKVAQLFDLVALVHRYWRIVSLIAQDPFHFSHQVWRAMASSSSTHQAWETHGFFPIHSPSLGDPWCLLHSPPPSLGDPWCLLHLPPSLGDPWCLLHPRPSLGDPWCLLHPPQAWETHGLFFIPHQAWENHGVFPIHPPSLGDPWSLPQPPTSKVGPQHVKQF